TLVELSNTELELDVLDREARIVESITQLQAYETQLEQNRIANHKALAQINYDIIRLQRSLQRRQALAAIGSISGADRRCVGFRAHTEWPLSPASARETGPSQCGAGRGIGKPARG